VNFLFVDEAIHLFFPHSSTRGKARGLPRFDRQLGQHLTENAVMKKVTIATNLIAGLILVSGAGQAKSPTYLYGTSTDSYGPAAITATAGTLSDNRSGYLVAAIADDVGNLEVKAWQDTTHELSEVGYYHATGSPIVAVAAADLNSSQVVTADIDQDGKLSIRTWTVGGTGITPLNSYTSAPGTATTLGYTPFVAIAALSATQVVTAYSNTLGDLILQAWNIPSGGIPARSGPASNGGAVAEIAIAALDSTTVMTATSDTNNDLFVTTWGVDSAGVHQQDQVMKANTAGSYSVPGVAIAAASVVSLNPTELPPTTVSRYAVTPVANVQEQIEVLYWQISPSGIISKTGDQIGPGQDVTDTAAVMLPSGVPMSVYNSVPYPATGDPNNIEVGWVGNTGETAVTEISGHLAAIESVSAAPAGDSYKTGDESQAVSAYFVTAALTGKKVPPSVAKPGKLQVGVWSYPVILPIE
jgi:hypothetical protein